MVSFSVLNPITDFTVKRTLLKFELYRHGVGVSLHLECDNVFFTVPSFTNQVG